MATNLTKHVLFSFYMMLSLSLFSCSSGTPRCDDKEVVSRVIELQKPSMLANFFHLRMDGKVGPDNGGITFSDLSDFVDDLKQGRFPYRGKAGEMYNSMKLRLDNIRTDKIDKDVLKSTCKATAEYEEKKTRLDIVYTATRTVDGKLFVEVLNK